jgi:hypothetical protein
VHLISYITARARVRLGEFIDIAQHDACYYCDTDSLVCSSEGYDRLRAAGCIDASRLGALKVEHNLVYFHAMAPKLYVYVTEK